MAGLRRLRSIAILILAGAGACSDKQPMQAGDPYCQPGQIACFGTCVMADANNCGACGSVCAMGQVCNGGVCGCPAGQTLCGASCIDVMSNATNCGGCGRSCATGQTCAGGTCTCQAGLQSCGTTCSNPQSDPANCGTCGTVCPATAPFCSLGACSAQCAPGLTPCGTACVNVLTEAANCGMCGVACPAGQSCANGACGCPAGQLNCGAGCLDVQSNPVNCGACGVTCPGGVCSAGACMSSGVGGSGGGLTGGSGGGLTGGSGGGLTGGSGGGLTGGSGGGLTGGAGGAGGGTGGGGTGGTGEVVIDCGSVSGSGLPLNATGWLDASCNSFGMQGAWYCFDDGVQTSTCVDGEPPFQPSGMCLTGTSVVDTTYASWGAGIGLSLNETGGDASVKTAFNATAAGIVGYRLTLTGDSLGRSMRIGYSTKLDPGDDLTPFVEVGAIVPGTPLVADVLIADAVVPEAWETIPNAGEYANPEAMFDLQVQYPGGDKAGQYSFCITKIEPITTGEIPTVDCSMSGAQAAGSTSDQYGQLNVGSYMIQNNVWNGNANGHQSISAYNVSGGVGFVVHADSGYNVLSDPSLRPGGYGSAVYGWHMDGRYHGGYTSPRAMNSITNARSRWEYCTPAAGNWNASYDIWIAPSGSQPSASNGTEMMIWTATRDATPIGTKQAQTVSVAGAQWEVWVGQGQAGPWQTISFRRITNTRVVDINIKDFMTAGDPFANYDMSHQLWGIQAGYEIWSTAGQNLNFTTALFSASVQ